ncbi:MAG TPA: sulfatase-like hydrolase/transferase [Vicinamibacterales bacterium]|nr:sulfatase-like hydrolase/transferase [Vicinamibacterales bacterium]
MRRVLVIFAAVAVAIGGVFAWRMHSRTSRPIDGPIVLISIDTLRADHLPVYGYRGVRTPAIDALAATSTVFENAYSHAPQTLPAHTTILTGELPFQTGVRDNIGFTLKDGQWTLPGALRSNGWATGGFVSAYVLRAATKINQGFDTYDADLPSASSEASLGQVQRDGALTLEAAERWLQSRKNDRVFLFIHFYEPHKPYSPPARFSEYAPYDGEIAYADELVGRLLDRLRQDKLFDRSTIVLLADHGEGLGDHGEQEHGMFLYQETMHVPLVVKLPGQRAGRRVAEPVQHIDIAPTLLALAGVAAPADLHGRNLDPLLEATGSVPETGIYAEAMLARYHFGWSELYSLTDARYRYVRAPRDELYDLRNDPHEKASIAAARPQIRQAMRGAIDRLLAGTSLAAPEAVTAADRERLAALGYVGNTSAGSLAAPGDSLPDPKDKAAVLERYREGTELAGKMRFADAVTAYRAALAADPEMMDVWTQLAQAYVRLGRSADAVDAFRHVIERDPKDAGALTGAASELLRMRRYEDAQKYAELAVSVAPANAHELLARIAIARNDAAAARREAQLAEQADPTLPMREIVEGTLLYNQKRYAECLPHFGRAAQALQRRTLQVPDVDYFIGDSLARLERYPEAERFLKAEIALFPFNTRARAGLAMLYRATGRDAEAEQAIAELLRVSPEGDGPALARQLWTIFGEPEKAAAVKNPGNPR